MGRLGSDRKTCSVNPDDYKLLEEIGHGGSAVVYRAIYLPSNAVVAVKCLDLERCNNNLDNIQKEAQTMSLIDHPNLITSYCSFVVDRCLWVVMPFMAEGSCFHIMKFAHPDGLRESVIGSILKDTLKALEYLHGHGHIHRDVKAGNILLDTDGTVKLGDFGVSACMFDKGDRQRARNTFIGTPCWMAPEVMQPGSGYDFKADIWSFGITALELAHGHAPFSKYPPMKVLLMTLQNAPPGLDYDRDKNFSKVSSFAQQMIENVNHIYSNDKSFKEMVAMCLVKDKKKRPTAAKLLKHSFFKRAKPSVLSVKKVLLDLPPIGDRLRSIQLKDAAQLALKEMPSAEEEARSQREYKRSVSGWNFDVEDLKIQASQVQDDDDVTGMKDEDKKMKLVIDDMDASSSSFGLVTTASSNSIDCRGSTSSSEISQAECLNEISDFGNKENFDGNGNSEPALHATEKTVQVRPKNQENRNCQAQNGSLTSNKALMYSLSERAIVSERCDNKQQVRTEKSKHNMQRAPSFNCPLTLPDQASVNSSLAPIRTSGGSRDTLEDSSKANLVQIKGRFSVTSENVDFVKESGMRKSASVGDFLLDSKQVPPNQSSKEANNSLASSAPASLLMCRLQSLLKQTSSLQDLIMISLNSFQQAETADVQLCSALEKGKLPPQPPNLENVATEETADCERRQFLLLKISEVQSRMADLTDELTTENLMHKQLQEQQYAPYCQNEEDRDGQGESKN